MIFFLCYFSARNALPPRADVFIIYIRAPECQNTTSGHVHYRSSSRRTMMPNLWTEDLSLSRWSFVIIIIIIFFFYFSIYSVCVATYAQSHRAILRIYYVHVFCD